MQWTRSEAQFRSAIADAQSVTTASAIDVAFSGSTGPSQATVLTAISVEVRAKTAPLTKKSTRYRATMNRVGGQWLIAKLEPVT